MKSHPGRDLSSNTQRQAGQWLLGDQITNHYVYQEYVHRFTSARKLGHKRHEFEFSGASGTALQVRSHKDILDKAEKDENHDFKDEFG